MVRRRWSALAVGLLTALYLAYFGWFTLRAYDAFVYQAHDLGIYNQVVWNTLHGRPFRSTLEEPYDILLGDHFEPILLLLVPFYWLWPGAKTLLLLQTAGLALGALPVYWLARDGLRQAVNGVAAEGSRGRFLAEVSAVGFAAVYLLYPAVHSANVFEFHPSALAVPCLLYTIYFLRRRWFVPYFLFLFLVMGSKEVMPLTTFVLGLYVLLVEPKRLIGLATMIASALWFGLVVFGIIPHFSPEGQSQYFGEYYGWLGSSAGQVMSRLLGHPELLWQRLTRADSLSYCQALLRPTAYVSLLGLPMLLVALPALFLNVLSDFPFQHNSLNFFQYAAAITPFVVVAAIDGTAFVVRQMGSLAQRIRPASKLTKERGQEACLWLALVVVGLSLLLSLAVQRYHGYLPFSRDFYLAPWNEKVAAAEAIVRQVPASGVVSADRLLGAHLSQRESIYLYPSLHEAEYVAVDVSYRDSPFPPRDRYQALQEMLATGRYGVVDGRYGYLLLKRGLEQQAIPERFYDFVHAANPSPQVQTDVTFGDELRLIGFDLVWERPVRPHARLVLYWQALRPVNRDLRLFFVLTDPSGNLLPGTELEFDATVWYPPARWSATETVRTATLPWSVEQPGKFGVAVGVVEGPGFWEVDKRLHPAIGSAPWPLPRLHDGSLVWLATLEADGRLATMEEPGLD